MRRSSAMVLPIANSAGIAAESTHAPMRKKTLLPTPASFPTKAKNSSSNSGATMKVGISTHGVIQLNSAR